MMVTLLPGTTRSHRYLREEGNELRKPRRVTAERRCQRCPLPVAVELQVTGHLSVWHSIRSLLQAERLEVDTNAAVWDDEVWVHGTLHSASILTEESQNLFERMPLDKIEQTESFLLFKLTCCTCAAERNPAGPEAEGCC